MPHTSGPWKVINSDMVVGSEGQLVADCERTPHCERPAAPTEEGMSNACLIAAAPELLEIAKAYRNYLKTMAHTEGEIATYHHIDETITKAEKGA